MGKGFGAVGEGLQHRFHSWWLDGSDPRSAEAEGWGFRLILDHGYNRGQNVLIQVEQKPHF